MIAYSQAYTEYVVDAYDMDIDLSLITEWKVSNTKRRAAAVFHPSIDGAEAGIPIDWESVEPWMVNGMKKRGFSDKRECFIQISRRAINELNEDEWRDTIRHELIHVEEYQKYGASGHGNTFKIRANDLDVNGRTCRAFTEPKYTIVCSACGEFVAGRHRKSKVVRDAMNQGGEYISKCCREPLALDA